MELTVTCYSGESKKPVGKIKKKVIIFQEAKIRSSLNK